MRVFWALMAVLALVTVVIMLRGGTDESRPPSMPPAMSTHAVDSSRPNAAMPQSDTDPGLGRAAATESPAVETQPDSAALAADLMSSAEQKLAASMPSVPPQDASGHNPVPAAPTDYQAKADEQAMAAAKELTIEPQADGSVLLDGKYTVRGSGSSEDPYQLSWDLLTSASESYQPRLGLTQIPQRVQMLSGKHVKISGYMAFPLAQMETSEVLVMLNMWDGCCIGIPPSPYDAIEVKLTEAIPYDKRRFINYGTLSGVMKVDPYLVNDWLLGLYLVEDATLDLGL